MIGAVVKGNSEICNRVACDRGSQIASAVNTEATCCASNLSQPAVSRTITARIAASSDGCWAPRPLQTKRKHCGKNHTWNTHYSNPSNPAAYLQPLTTSLSNTLLRLPS
jgi:hypothetical protein